MYDYDRHNTMFDSLGDSKFTRMSNQLIRLEFGNNGFIPGPRKGQDGNIDSKFLKTESGKPKSQYKFREVGGANDKKLRADTVNEYKKWLADVCKSDAEGTFLFITNVRRTKADRDTTDSIAESYTKAKIIYWDFDQLSTLMDVYPDIAKGYLKIYDSEELHKKQNELDEKEAKLAAEEKEIYLRTPEFVNVSLKLKTQFIDWTLIAAAYHGFLYLVEPVYVDDQDHVRAAMRQLFQIDNTAEDKVIDILKSDGRIDITGNIITVNKTEDAVRAAKLLADELGADLQKIISLIQGA